MATYYLPPPEPMVYRDVAANWKVFKEAFTDYATATQLTEKEATIQAATLKTIMGKECRQILSHLEGYGDHPRQVAGVLGANLKHFVRTISFSHCRTATKRNSRPVHDLPTSFRGIM